MERISVVGPPGSGKTTFARRLAGLCAAPFVELDSIVHQAGWNDLAGEELRGRVSAAISGDRWVVDGNYRAVLDLVWERADTVVWLDLPRRVVMRRVIARTLRRALTRQELWNGNREPLTNFYRWDPERNIVRWTWVTYPQYAAAYARAMEEPPVPGLRFVRMASRQDVEELIARLESR